MKKILVLFIIFLNPNSILAQQLPNVFKVGNYVEVLPNDSIKIWYNCVGAISNSTCSDFYRIGKIDPDRIGWVGEFRDYDMRGNLIYKAQMFDGKLEGKAYFYYPNHNIQATGNYENDARRGIWKYYYANSQAESVLNFISDNPDIIQEYNKKGKTLVSDGNGTYIGLFKGEKECEPGFKITGKVKNGKMDGEWDFDGIANEFYNEGTFIKGVSSRGYGGEQYQVNKPKIRISGFCANENTDLTENSVGCPGDHVGFRTYKSSDLVSIFYPQLIKKIKTFTNLNRQWLIVAIEFDRTNRIKTLNVYSSKHDNELTTFVYNYIQSLNGADWKPGSATSETNPPLFFSISIDPSLGKEKVLIPAEYIIRREAEEMRNLKRH